jgi:polysaccharide biosynthesis protein PslH
MAIIGVITSRFPYPLDKGDKLRIFNQVKSLSERHQVKLVCISSHIPKKSDLEAVKSICAELEIIHLSFFQKCVNLWRAFFSTLPLQVGLFFTRSKVPFIHNYFKECDVIYAHLIRVSEYVKDLPQRKTLDYMDAFSKGVERWHNSAHFRT